MAPREREICSYVAHTVCEMNARNYLEEVAHIILSPKKCLIYIIRNAIPFCLDADRVPFFYLTSLVVEPPSVLPFEKVCLSIAYPTEG